MSPRDVTNIPRNRRISKVLFPHGTNAVHPDIQDARRWFSDWSFRERCLLALIALFIFAITVILGGSKGEADSINIYQRHEEARDLR